MESLAGRKTLSQVSDFLTNRAEPANGTCRARRRRRRTRASALGPVGPLLGRIVSHEPGRQPGGRAGGRVGGRPVLARPYPRPRRSPRSPRPCRAAGDAAHHEHGDPGRGGRGAHAGPPAGRDAGRARLPLDGAGRGEAHAEGRREREAGDRRERGVGPGVRRGRPGWGLADPDRGRHDGAGGRLSRAARGARRSPGRRAAVEVGARRDVQDAGCSTVPRSAASSTWTAGGKTEPGDAPHAAGG